MEGAVILSLHEAIMMQLDEVRDLLPAPYLKLESYAFKFVVLLLDGSLHLPVRAFKR